MPKRVRILQQRFRLRAGKDEGEQLAAAAGESDRASKAILDGNKLNCAQRQLLLIETERVIDQRFEVGALQVSNTALAR